MATLFSIRTEEFELHWRRLEGGTRRHDLLWEPPGRLAVVARAPTRVAVDRHAPPPLQFPEDPSATRLGPRLEEETSYYVYIRPRRSVQIALGHDDPVAVSNIDSEPDGTVHGTINFRSDVGRSRFTVLVDAKPTVDFEVEVFPTKLDYESDYRGILAEVQDLATGLALEYLRSTYQFGQAFKGTRASHLEWAVLLRHVFDDLERSLRHIADRPRRSLRRQAQLVPAERVTRPDSSVLSAISRGAGSGSFLKTQSGLRVRRKLWTQPAEPTLDTPEHRWLASRVQRVRRRLSSLVGELSKVGRYEEVPARRRQVIEQLTTLENRVSRLEALPPLREAQGEPPPGFTSQQLLSAPGYREAYQASLLLDACLRLNGRAIRTSAKALHELYEYWCYLTVVRLVSENIAAPVDPSNLFSLRNSGLRLELERGRESVVRFVGPQHRIVVRFNPHFADPGMLVPQRPDIVISFLQTGGPDLHLVLDAKYRRDDSEEHRNRYGGIGPPEDALNIMHRYRDAILYTNQLADAPRHVVVEAAAVFPHRDTTKCSHRSSRHWRLLQEMGVGAIPALPNATDYLSEWIANAVGHGGWSLGDRAIRHAAAEQVDRWRAAASESVVLVRVDPKLLGAARHGGVVRQAWVDAEYQLRARWVAFLVSDHSEVVGYASVQRVSVRPDRDDLLEVRYECGRVHRISIRPSSSMEPPPAWTSKLALDRASHLIDLYARTEAEWRLREQLRGEGLFRGVRLPTDDADHPWFLAAESRVRYAGASGYEIRDARGNESYVARVEEVSNVLDTQTPRSIEA